MFQLRIKPAFLHTRRIDTILKTSFHWTITYHALTTFHSRSARRLHLVCAGEKSSPRDRNSITFLALFVKKKSNLFYKGLV
jgi:hypothetical protein